MAPPDPHMARLSAAQGEVLRWHHENGLERIEAATYMEQLEQQVAALKQQLSASQPLASSSSSFEEDDAWLAGGRSSASGSGAGKGGGGSRSQEELARKLLPAASGFGRSRGGTGASAAASAAMAAASAAAGNRGELLGFLQTLSGDGMVGLTADASPEVLDAIDAFVGRLMGTRDEEQLRNMSSEFSSNELSKVLLWLLVVGYALRTAEMRMDVSMDRPS